MTPEFVQLLDQLAKKLGTTVEQLFAIYTTQARIEGIVGLVQYVGIFFTIVVWVTTFERWNKREYGMGESRGLVMISTGLCLLVLTIIAFCSFGETAGQLMNPQYWAASKLLGAVRG